MAVGYSFVSTVRILLEAGANPEIPDSQARNVVQLVDSIRDSMPFNPQLAQKRIALEEVSAMLTGFVPCFSADIGACFNRYVDCCCYFLLYNFTSQALVASPLEIARRQFSPALEGLGAKREWIFCLAHIFAKAAQANPCLFGLSTLPDTIDWDCIIVQLLFRNSMFPAFLSCRQSF